MIQKYTCTGVLDLCIFSCMQVDFFIFSITKITDHCWLTKWWCTVADFKAFPFHVSLLRSCSQMTQWQLLAGVIQRPMTQDSQVAEMMFLASFVIQGPTLVDSEVMCVLFLLFLCVRWQNSQVSGWEQKHCGSQTQEIQLEFSSPQWGLGSSEQLHLVSMVLKSCQLIIHQYSYGSSAGSFVFSFPSAMQTFSVVALFCSTSGWKHCKM